MCFVQAVLPLRVEIILIPWAEGSGASASAFRMGGALAARAAVSTRTLLVTGSWSAPAEFKRPLVKMQNTTDSNP